MVLEGKVGLVTGAGQRIGKASALHFVTLVQFPLTMPFDLIV